MKLTPVLAAGILMFNVESAGELDVIESRARALQKIGRVSIRVNPDVEADTHPYISTGQMIHKFGVPKDEAPELYRRAARSPHLKVQGVACHIGSQILDVEPFLKALDEILGLEMTESSLISDDGTPQEVLISLRRLGVSLLMDDFGTGYSSLHHLHSLPFDALKIDRSFVSRMTGGSEGARRLCAP